MTITEAIFDDLEKAWSEKDIDALVALFTEDCIYEDMALGARHAGHAGVREFAEGVFAVMPDFSLTFPVRVVTAERGSSHWIIRAHWNGDFEGIDRTGHPIEFTGLSSYSFRGDRIVHNIDCWDYVAMIKAFGVLPSGLAALPHA
jgi:predicted ester cyclase